MGRSVRFPFGSGLTYDDLPFAGLQQLFAERDGDGFGAVGGAEFPVGGVDVVADAFGAESVLSFLRYKPNGLEASFRAVVKDSRRVTPWDRTMQYSLEITEEYFGGKGRNGK